MDDTSTSKEQMHMRFLNVASLCADWSPDPSTKVGAILVHDSHNIVSNGYNAFPVEIHHPVKMYHDRPYKYKHIRHAEVSCLMNFVGTIDDKHSLYCTHPPCEMCAGIIIGYGVKKVISYVPSQDYESRWMESVQKASEIFEIGGVDFIKFSLDK